MRIYELVLAEYSIRICFPWQDVTVHSDDEGVDEWSDGEPENKSEVDSDDKDTEEERLPLYEVRNQWAMTAVCKLIRHEF